MQTQEIERMSKMTEQEAKQRKEVDRIIYEAAEVMVTNGVGIGVLLDRFITFSAGQACSSSGAIHAAQAFRSVADQVEAGAFMHLEPEPEGQGH